MGLLRSLYYFLGIIAFLIMLYFIYKNNFLGLTATMDGALRLLGKVFIKGGEWLLRIGKG